MEINIRGLDIRECFEMFLAEWKEDEEEDIGRLVIFGINLGFSLFDYVKGRRNIVEKDKIGKVYINGKTYRIEEFDMELARRERVMKEYLIDKLENKPIVKPRGIKV